MAQFALAHYARHGNYMIKCRACNNSEGNEHHIFHEHYLGTGDAFGYIQCNACGSLSIVDIPTDLPRFYPPNYYSFAPKPYNRILGLLKGYRDRYYLGKFSIVGSLVSFYSKAPNYIEWLKKLNLEPGSHILDVGCGSGTLIANLTDAGFRPVGIDPFIESTVIHANGATVFKQTLEETKGVFDCIMLHHSLEHMANPHGIFSQLNRLLKSTGKLLIRVPLAGTYAWKHYGENWFQLDAPRHAVLFTESALCNLAAEFGFDIQSIVYDSSASQFWGSEQYLHGISHISDKSHAINPSKSIFSATDMDKYKSSAEALNNDSNGDQAVFYFIKRIKSKRI